MMESLDANLCRRCLAYDVLRQAPTSEQKLAHIEDHITMECRMKADTSTPNRFDIMRTCFPRFFEEQINSPLPNTTYNAVQECRTRSAAKPLSITAQNTGTPRSTAECGTEVHDRQTSSLQESRACETDNYINTERAVISTRPTGEGYRAHSRFIGSKPLEATKNNIHQELPPTALGTGVPRQNVMELLRPERRVDSEHGTVSQEFGDHSQRNLYAPTQINYSRRGLPSETASASGPTQSPLSAPPKANRKLALPQRAESHCASGPLAIAASPSASQTDTIPNHNHDDSVANSHNRSLTEKQSLHQQSSMPNQHSVAVSHPGQSKSALSKVGPSHLQHNHYSSHSSQSVEAAPGSLAERIRAYNHEHSQHRVHISSIITNSNTLTTTPTQRRGGTRSQTTTTEFQMISTTVKSTNHQQYQTETGQQPEGIVGIVGMRESSNGADLPSFQHGVAEGSPIQLGGTQRRETSRQTSSRGTTTVQPSHSRHTTESALRRKNSSKGASIAALLSNESTEPSFTSTSTHRSTRIDRVETYQWIQDRLRTSIDNTLSSGALDVGVGIKSEINDTAAKNGASSAAHASLSEADRTSYAHLMNYLTAIEMKPVTMDDRLKKLVLALPREQVKVRKRINVRSKPDPRDQSPDENRLKVCDDCGTETTRMVEHMYIHRLKEMKCHFCPFTTKFHKTMCGHVKDHHSGLRFNCQFCPRTFLRAREIKRHTQRIHQKVPDPLRRNGGFICDQCGRAFDYLYNLGLHQSNHRNLFPWQCPTCHNKYRFKSSLTSHMTKHRLSRNYFCDICDNSFKDRYSLQNHITIHTGERAFECKACGATFRVRVLLRNHHQRYGHFV